MEGTRGPVISPEHRSPGFHDLPVAADTALTLRLRCRIAVANRFPVYFPSNDPQLTRRLRCGRPRRTLRIYHICAVLITMLLGLFSRVHIEFVTPGPISPKPVRGRLFIPPSTAVRHESSIPFHHGLCTHATRWRSLVAGLYSVASQPRFHRLCVAPGRGVARGLRFGSPSQTASPLNPSLMIHGLPGGFAMDDQPAATR